MRILFRFAIVLLLTIAARADSFDFTFHSRNFDLDGTLYGNLISPGVYQITWLTGTQNPGKEPPLNELNYVYTGEFDAAHNDNLLFTHEPFVDSFGIAFFTGQTVYYSMIHDDIGYALLGCASTCTHSTLFRIPGELEVSPVPEPQSLLLMASGITLLGMRMRRQAGERQASVTRPL